MQGAQEKNNMQQNKTITVDEILDEARYIQWSDLEQSALAEMLSIHNQGKPFVQGTFQTGRVTTTFIKLLSTCNE